MARMQDWLGDEYPAFAASYDAPPRQGLRANTLKIEPAALAEALPFPLEPLPYPPACWLLPADEGQPGKHPYHAAGLYYLQDPSAMVPAALLDARPGERVLDLSAAPGGKATQLASALANRGLLVANEVHPQRAWDLAENLERWGARNVVILNETPERVAAAFGEFFDRVLVDAPCSGEGMLRRSQAARREWAPELVEGCALRQDRILAQAAATLRPGGTLLYATCTFAAIENEGTVARFLARHPGFTLEEIPAYPGFAAGRPEWLPPPLRQPELERALRLWPHRYPGEGQFVALLRKTGRVTSATEGGRQGSGEPRTVEGVAETRRSARGSSAHKPGGPGRPLTLAPSRSQRQLYGAFCAEHLVAVPAESDLAVSGAYLYYVSLSLPDLTGLRVIHPGWWLGSFKKDRFEPSHALALSLGSRDARRSLDLAPDGPGVQAYLRGESLRDDGEAGWVLITTAGYPLGWAKRVGGYLKSHYPRGLRRP